MYISVYAFFYCFISIFFGRSTLRAISIEKEALKRRIQTDTQTTIKCTKIKADGGKKRVLEIKGSTHKDVYSARQQIKAINGNGDTESKQSIQPTHFTCVKITDPTIKENFSKLKVYFMIDKFIMKFVSIVLRPFYFHRMKFQPLTQ